MFGHSHIPYKQYHGETLLFNPGSPTDKRFQPEFSYGIVTLEEHWMRSISIINARINVT